MAPTDTVRPDPPRPSPASAEPSRLRRSHNARVLDDVGVFRVVGVLGLLAVAITLLVACGAIAQTRKPHHPEPATPILDPAATTTGTAAHPAMKPTRNTSTSGAHDGGTNGVLDGAVTAAVHRGDESATAAFRLPERPAATPLTSAAPARYSWPPQPFRTNAGPQGTWPFPVAVPPPTSHSDTGQDTGDDLSHRPPAAVASQATDPPDPPTEPGGQAPARRHGGPTARASSPAPAGAGNTEPRTGSARPRKTAPTPTQATPPAQTGAARRAYAPTGTRRPPSLVIRLPMGLLVVDLCLPGGHGQASPSITGTPGHRDHGVSGCWLPRWRCSHAGTHRIAFDRSSPAHTSTDQHPDGGSRTGQPAPDDGDSADQLDRDGPGGNRAHADRDSGRGEPSPHGSADDARAERLQEATGCPERCPVIPVGPVTGARGRPWPDVINRPPRKGSAGLGAGLGPGQFVWVDGLRISVGSSW
jgi:hypothetical protein